jgi:hypothetical protein
MSGAPARLEADTLVGVLASRPGRKSPAKKLPVKFENSEEKYSSGKMSH